MIEAQLKPIRATVHRSEMPNWTGVRVVITGPRDLLDQVVILAREGFEIVTPPAPLLAWPRSTSAFAALRAATRPPP